MSSFRSPSILGLNSPFASIFVKLGSNNYSLKGTIFAKLENLVCMIKVCLKLIPAGVVGGPVPIFVHFRDGKLIDRYRAIDPSAWVDILDMVRYMCQAGDMWTYPAPGTTKALAGIVQYGIEALLPAFIQ